MAVELDLKTMKAAIKKAADKKNKNNDQDEIGDMFSGSLDEQLNKWEDLFSSEEEGNAAVYGNTNNDDQVDYVSSPTYQQEYPGQPINEGTRRTLESAANQWFKNEYGEDARSDAPIQMGTSSQQPQSVTMEPMNITAPRPRRELPSTSKVDSPEYLDMVRNIDSSKYGEGLSPEMVQAYRRMKSQELSPEGLSSAAHYQAMGPGLGPAPGAFPVRPDNWYPVPSAIADDPRAIEYSKQTGKAPIGMDPNKMTPQQEEYLRSLLKEEMGPEKYQKLMERLYRDTGKNPGELMKK